MPYKKKSFRKVVEDVKRRVGGKPVYSDQPNDVHRTVGKPRPGVMGSLRIGDQPYKSNMPGARMHGPKTTRRGRRADEKDWRKRREKERFYKEYRQRQKDRYNRGTLEL